MVDIDEATNPPTILSRKGDKLAELACVREPVYATGMYDIVWTTPRTDGINFVAMISGKGQ